MAALLVAYDLNSPGQRHTDLLAYLKKHFGWAKLSESAYAIATDLTPDQVYAALKTFLDKNDQLYVIKLNHAHAGQGPKAINDWLAKHL